MKVHSSAGLFPALSSVEASNLADDIAANGLQHPILYRLVDGEPELLDGRSRLDALNAAGIEPDLAVHFRLMEAPTDEDVRRIVISNNILRRHLKPEQMAELHRTLAATGMTAKEMATATNSSRQTVERNAKDELAEQREKKRAEQDAKFAAEKAAGKSDRQAAKEAGTPLMTARNRRAYQNAQSGQNGTPPKSKPEQRTTNPEPTPKPEPVLGAYDRIAAEYQLPLGSFSGRKDSEDMRQLTVYMTEPIREAFDRRAADLGMSSVALIVQAIARHVGVHLDEEIPEKVQARLSRIERRLEAEWQDKFSAAITEHINEVIRPIYGDKLKQAERLINSRQRPPFSSDEYRTVLAALHPDASPGEKRNEAFRLVKEREYELRGDKEKTFLTGLPTTPEEWAEAKRRVSAERAAKRAAVKA